MRVLFYGAGVIGSLYAVRLQEAGHEVSVVARGRRLADLRRHGIVLEEAGTGHRTAARVGVVQQLDPGDAYDLIVVAVRKNQLPPILPELARNLRAPDVLLMLNNAAGPDGVQQHSVQLLHGQQRHSQRIHRHQHRRHVAQLLFQQLRRQR